MRKLMGCAALLAGLGLSTSANAEWYLGGMGSYFVPDSARESDDGFGGRALVGFPIGWSAIEVSLFGQQYDAELSDDTNSQLGLGVDWMVPFTKGSFRPFGVIGVNYMADSLYGFDDESFAADAGLGALVKLTKSLDLRVEGRYVGVFNDPTPAGEDPFGDLVFGLGLQASFGGKGDEAPAECSDSDADGVCDEADLCPGTEPGVKVDAKGCPIVETAAKPAAEQKLATVYFEFDKSELSSKAMSDLDAAAGKYGDLSKAYPELKIDVSGHTDWIGTDGYNQSLSERRANSAKNYLVRKGIDSSSINVFAYGESRPVAPNANADGSDNAEGRALNRRAEVETSID